MKLVSEAGVHLDHESYVAGALLTDANRTLRDVRGLLTADSFENTTYRAMFEAATALEAEGVSIDAVVLRKRVERDGTELPAQLCADLIRAIPTLEALNFYAERVAEAADARHLKALLLESYTRLDEGDSLGTVRGELERSIDAIKERNASALISSGDAMYQTYQGLMEAAGGKKLFVGTGYGKLNNILGGGFIKAGLHILAARPGTGKTTLALQIAENVAAKGIKTLFISLEMGIDQLQHRRLAVEAGLSLAELHSIGQGEKETWDKIAAASAKLSGRPLYFNLVPSLSVSRIERYARSIDAEFVVIDYLGLIQHQGSKSIYEKVTETSNALKRMAVRLNIPILCLCQLNRGASGREPQLAELRDSGAIEQDADTVILQWLPEGRPEGENFVPYAPVNLEVIVAKNRHGAQGKVPFSWYMNCGRIRE